MISEESRPTGFKTSYYVPPFLSWIWRNGIDYLFRHIRGTEVPDDFLGFYEQISSHVFELFDLSSDLQRAPIRLSLQENKKASTPIKKTAAKSRLKIASIVIGALIDNPGHFT